MEDKKKVMVMLTTPMFGYLAVTGFVTADGGPLALEIFDAELMCPTEDDGGDNSIRWGDRYYLSYFGYTKNPPIKRLMIMNSQVKAVILDEITINNLVSYEG